MVKNIIYYDETAPELCLKLCNLLKVNYLPSFNGNDRHQYDSYINKFDRIMSIPNERRVQAYERIFTDNTLKAFRNAESEHGVLFVYEGDILIGIVQLYDFNRNIVLQTIQNDVLTFERLLRRHLVNNGKSDNDLRGHFEECRKKKKKDSERYLNKIKDFDRRHDERRSLGPFQTADLSDLIQFSSSSVSGPLFKIKNDIKLIKLRNLAMHAKDSVGLDTTTNLYTVEGLEILIDQLEHLKTTYNELFKLVITHSNYIENRKRENRARLEQISDLGASALSYFLDF